MIGALPSELVELDRFLESAEERRDAVGRGVASILGAGWTYEGLVGQRRLCSVRYSVLDLVFVLIPGGTFEMGFRDGDREAVARVMDREDPFVERFLAMCEARGRPVRRVTVRPFLFPQCLLDRTGIDRIDPSRGTDEVDRERRPWRSPQPLGSGCPPRPSTSGWRGRAGGCRSPATRPPGGKVSRSRCRTR